MKPHKWSLCVFDDGSGVWLCEWRDEFVYRCHTPSRPKPTAYETDQSIPEHRGYSKQSEEHISRDLAKQILNAWKKSRENKRGGWIDL